MAFTDNFTSAWAMFSTRGSNNQLFTSTNTGGGATDTPIGGQYIGSAHKYRIQWDAGQVQYYVDGTLVHTDNATFGSNLNVAASDFNSGGPGLSVNWLHLSPYPSSGTFTSRVFDAGQAADWGAMSWHANAPPGTSVAMSVRTGNTPTPDGSWSAFTPVTSSGDDVPGNSRYVQYKADLDPDPNLTSAIEDVSIAYATGADTTAPTITQRTPAPNATNVPREHQRQRPVQRADEPGDDRRLDRSAAKAGGRQRRSRRASATRGTPRRSIRTPTSIRARSTT